MAFRHTILCVDDEENILSALKRVLRKEDCRLITATSGREGLEILGKEKIHLVVSDHRMPEMSGIEFLARIKECYPEIIRIVLTGYTDVDAITEAINKGHIFKFLLKPWNDQNLRLEIRQALDQYDLMEANRRLSEKVMEQNEALGKINEDLERLVQERTMALENQNCALELSHAILEDLPMPVVGVSAEGMVVLMNRAAQEISASGKRFELGKALTECASGDVVEKTTIALCTHERKALERCSMDESSYQIDFIPLSGRFLGNGVILAFTPAIQLAHGNLE